MRTTERALRHAMAQGLMVGVVERHRPSRRMQNKAGEDIFVQGNTQDLFGIFDLLAVEPGCPGVAASHIAGIQACGEDVTQHKKKILDSPYTEDWMRAGGGVQLWACRKRKKKNKDGSWSKRTYWKVTVFWLCDPVAVGVPFRWEEMESAWWRDGKKRKKVQGDE